MSFDKIIAVRTDKTVYRDGDRCLKVFGEEYSKSDVLVEALNQARVEEAGLDVPEILGVTVTDGKWTIISKYIKGKTLERLALENPEKKDEYIAYQEPYQYHALNFLPLRFLSVLLHTAKTSQLDLRKHLIRRMAVFHRTTNKQ